MQRRHDPTYYWATRRLPAEIRPATHALYGYVRTADEIVDGPRRPPSAAARRAALDAWEARARARAGRRPLAAPGRRRARRRRPPPPAAARRAAHLHALDADRLRAGADRDLAGARGLHGRLGRLGRADHGAAARRARAPPRRLRPARAGVPARRTSSATCARTPRSTASTCRPRTASASAWRRTTCAARSASPELRALLALEVRRARAAVRRGASRRSPPRPARCAPACGFAVARLPARARPRRADRLRRARPPRPACAPGSSRAPRSGRCAGDAPGHPARRRAHAARGRRRAPTC